MVTDPSRPIREVEDWVSITVSGKKFANHRRLPTAPLWGTLPLLNPRPLNLRIASIASRFRGTARKGRAMGRPPRGRPSRGKQRIEIRYIEKDESRQVTSCKRRTGMFKKASELSTLCGASVAVVTFSKAGNVFAFGDPSVDAVLHCYAPLRQGDGAAPAPAHVEDGDAPSREELNAVRQAAEQTKAQVKAEEARMRDIAGKITQAKAGRQFWWEADVEALGEGELPDFARALERLRDNVSRRVNTLLSTTLAPPAVRRRRSKK
ncbi:hypothetical protein E2562_012870 [Oryza meyeriana var. granulata]|uniref:MADS-box domain-containing protein n=1 Tax=Oryza meyeriana var. granulata TaxID=110450 RepID=A0A6G1CPR4_9ORYZ|nr:hypothetical protein E2562_012870 [Oryza meyeriana var. granulata]